MPHPSLTENLRLYSCGSKTQCPVVASIPPGNELIEKEKFGDWYLLTFSGGEGYALKTELEYYSGSPTNPDRTLTYFENMVAEEIKIKRTAGFIYIKAVGVCYVFEVLFTDEIPTTATTLKSFINQSGGLRNMTAEEKANCVF